MFRGSQTGTRSALCAALNDQPTAPRLRLLDVGLLGDPPPGTTKAAPTPAVCRWSAPHVSLEDQDDKFNAVLLVDGNAAAWRFVRQLPLDMLNVVVESCCETNVDLVIDPPVIEGDARSNATSSSPGEVWRVAGDLSDLDSVLQRFDDDPPAAMRTAAAAVAFSLSHLNDDSSMCYAVELLHRYARLQPFETTLHPHAAPVLRPGTLFAWPEAQLLRRSP